jgi:hypothetical protein
MGLEPAVEPHAIFAGADCLGLDPCHLALSIPSSFTEAEQFVRR